MFVLCICVNEHLYYIVIVQSLKFILCKAVATSYQKKIMHIIWIKQNFWKWVKWARNSRIKGTKEIAFLYGFKPYYMLFFLFIYLFLSYVIQRRRISTFSTTINTRAAIFIISSSSSMIIIHLTHILASLSSSTSYYFSC